MAEDAELTPVTPYGETKAIAERQLGELASDSFSPTYLRNATAYGASPRLRLDIVVNNLTAVATTTGQVRMESDGSPWRPLVHIEDICRATGAVLTARRELVHDEAFNVGRPEDNVQVRQIAELVNEAVPGSRISFADGAGPDLRNYRVDFSKLNDTFPDLQLSWTVQAGVDELAGAYTEHGLTHDDFLSSRYVRLRRIKELLDDGIIDDTLRRKRSAGWRSLKFRGSPARCCSRPPRTSTNAGFFCRTFDTEIVRAAGIDPFGFAQDSLSRSRLGVIRGMHVRRGAGEAKLVRCSFGAIYDVIVDLRPGFSRPSATGRASS